MIFNIFVLPCVIIDELADVWVEDVIKILVGVFAINVWGDKVIDTSGVYIDVTFDMPDIDVEVLTDVNANVLVTVVTAL